MEVSSKKLATSEQIAQQNMVRCSHCEVLLEPLNIGPGAIVRVNKAEDDFIEVENSKTVDRPSRVKREKKIGGTKEMEWEIVLGKYSF